MSELHAETNTHEIRLQIAAHLRGDVETYEEAPAQRATAEILPKPAPEPRPLSGKVVAVVILYVVAIAYLTVMLYIFI